MFMCFDQTVFFFSAVFFPTRATHTRLSHTDHRARGLLDFIPLTTQLYCLGHTLSDLPPLSPALRLPSPFTFSFSPRF